MDEIFYINQRIEVARLGSDDFYSTRLEDITKDTFVVAAPLQRGMLSVYEGEELQGIVLTKDKQLYGFRLKIIKRVRDRLSYWITSIPYFIKKIQRRNFFRLGIVFPIDVYLYDFKANAYKDEPERCFTTDLSAGGLAFVLKNGRVRVGDKLKVAFKLDLIEAVMYLEASVVRADKKINEEDNSIMYAVGLKFCDITEPMQDKIVRYVNAVLIDRRKRGVQ